MSTRSFPLRRTSGVLLLGAIVFAALLNFSPSARASTSEPSNWSQVTTPFGQPTPRDDASMVFDASTGTTVLFGGFDGTQLGETWTWNGSVWNKMTPATSPPALQGAAMTYDSATHNVVLFGGLSSNGPVADTWTWDGATWTEHFAPGPVARSHASMVYDAATNNVMLFGGESATGPLSDTWLWNGITWTAATSANQSPSPRQNQSMVYDGATHNVVLFGGLSSNGPLNDTWTWDAGTWSRQPAASPPARSGASMFYDSTLRQVVLFGGDSASSALSDNWTWNGASWVRLLSATAPTARYLASVAYDGVTNSAVLFGGYNGTATLSDTWSFMVTPSAPLKVQANSNANTESTVVWNAPSLNGGATVYGYDVTAIDVTLASRGGQTCSTLGTTVVTVPSSGVVATSCVVTGLTNGDQYKFAVTALNTVGAGTAGYSNVVRPATVPGPPTISQVVMGSGAATVHWIDPVQTGGTPVASYRVVASSGGAFCHVPRSFTSCRIVGLQGGVNYTFTISATNAAGTGASSVPSGVTQAILLPGAPRITSKSVAGSYITIGWQPPPTGGTGVVGYDIYIGTSPNGAASRPLVAVSANQLTYTFRGVPGLPMYVIVRAVDTSGIGPFSNQVAAEARTSSPPRPPQSSLRLPSAPFISKSSVAGAYVTVRWQPPLSNGGIRLSGYDIFIGSSPNGAAYRPMVSVAFNQFSYTFRGSRGHRFFIIVRAANEFGMGPFSNQVTVVAK